jgi:VCBS repeat-containing protein
MSNTPQASGDVYNYSEDQLSSLLSSKNVITLNVMANDLGGNAKTLYSIDDGSGSFLTDLLQSNVNTSWESTEGGNLIRIANGKVELDISHSLDGRSFEALKAGETITDSFVYSIRLANGTLSWARVSVTLTGSNDGPTGTAEASLAAGWEDGPYTIRASDLLQGFSDVDGDALSVADLSAEHGTLANNGNGIWTFTPAANYNGPVALHYNVVDGNGGSVAASQSFTLAAVNDAPEGAASAALAAGEEDSAYTIRASDLLQGFSDVDGDIPSVADLSTEHGTLADSGNGTWVFTPAANYNGPVALHYNVVDGHGGSVAASQSFTLAAVNDLPDIRLVSSDSATASLTETNAGLTASGTLSVTDADSSDAISSTASSVVASGTTTGLGLSNAQLLSMMSVSPASGLAADAGDEHNLSWSFDSAAQAFDYLLPGQTLTLSYTIASSDGHSGTDTQQISITISGTADVAAAPQVYNGVDPNDLVTPSGPVNSSASTGADVLVGTSNADTISAKNGDDSIFGFGGDDLLNGESGADLIYGGAGNDELHGNSETDRIYGGSGNDTIYGEAAADTIIGGYGADTLTGGSQADRFTYLSALDTGDTITDFLAGTDKIDFSAIDANPGAAGDQAFVSVTNSTTLTSRGVNWFFDDHATASTADDTTVVQFDLDGNVNTAELQIQLIGNINLSPSDFVL